ncbi:hypothetical protein BpHYR1_006066 [Brachionus plicatilis]|uniref:Uncharacterized protein n=1 Tax=Brachionus plicatilis TaxID=10195 RepID=A0A3M7RDT9_BRAPC|nr:hypothetical protein BpHYR1_006066 [Brachionus plicatilis]
MENKLHKMKDVMDQREHMCDTYRKRIKGNGANPPHSPKEMKQSKKNTYEKIEKFEDMSLKATDDLAVKAKFIISSSPRVPRSGTHSKNCYVMNWIKLSIFI